MSAITGNFPIPRFVLFSLLALFSTKHASSQSYVLSVEAFGAGAGTITSSPAGIDCSYNGATTVGTNGHGVCAATFPRNTRVTLTPSVSEGRFHRWDYPGCNVGIQSCAVTVDRNLTINTSWHNDNPKPPAQAHSAGLSMLSFQDDFTGLNASPNYSGPYSWYNPGLWYDRAAPVSNIRVSPNGILELLWRSDQSSYTTSISSAMSNGKVVTGGRSWQSPFYAEARLSWQQAIGAWPAFWFVGENNLTTSANGAHCEVDGFEGQGAQPKTYYGSLHEWNADGAGGHKQNRNQAAQVASMAGFHKYGVLVTSTTTTWYFDDQAIISAETYPVCRTNRMYLILGSQMGAGSIYGNNPQQVTNVSMYIDYVRVWTAGDASGEAPQ